MQPPLKTNIRRQWYAVKTPWWMRSLYPSMVWRMPDDQSSVYLSFDDGPHPVATPFILDLLEQYRAKASFFCVGNNVAAYPDIYQRILDEGHSVGNHTQQHLNGWNTPKDAYLADIKAAAKWIKPGLFRPPYGRIRREQVKALRQEYPNWKLVMWDVLSGDLM